MCVDVIVLSILKIAQIGLPKVTKTLPTSLSNGLPNKLAKLDLIEKSETAEDPFETTIGVPAGIPDVCADAPCKNVGPN